MVSEFDLQLHISVLHRFSSSFFPAQPLPYGGILADEMGLGKTVEMLALILAHKWTGMESCSGDPAPSGGGVEGSMMEEDQIMCLCGDQTEASPGDKGMVQCERCLKWQHMHCCGFSEEHKDDVFICTRCLLQKVEGKNGRGGDQTELLYLSPSLPPSLSLLPFLSLPPSSPSIARPPSSYAPRLSSSSGSRR